MERIDLIETHDMSAIVRFEEALEHRRQQAAETANEAARTKAASEATAARLKAEAEKRAAFLKAGAGLALSAVGVGVAVLLSTWAVSLLSRPISHAAPPPQTTQASPQPRTPNPPSDTTEKEGGNTVTNFVQFKHQKLDQLTVTTGWAYHNPEDAAPFRQHCYINLRGGVMLTIAYDRQPASINVALASSLGITDELARKALDRCEWFSGANDNIKGKP